MSNVKKPPTKKIQIFLAESTKNRKPAEKHRFLLCTLSTFATFPFRPVLREVHFIFVNLLKLKNALIQKQEAMPEQDPHWQIRFCVLYHLVGSA